MPSYSNFPILLCFFFAAAVVFAFFLCWAPFHAQRLGYVYFRVSPSISSDYPEPLLPVRKPLVEVKTASWSFLIKH